MSEVNLKQIARETHQIEIICHLLNCHPHTLLTDEISAITELLERMASDLTEALTEIHRESVGGVA